MIRSKAPDARRARPDRRVRTVADELEWGRRKLERAGRPHPDTWSLATWAVLRGQKPGAAWLERTAPAPDDFVRRYRAAIGAQVAGAPFQTSVGQAAFRHLDLDISPDVLIPRSETEDLVGKVLAWCRDRFGSGRWGIAADVCTGSGAIALALATEGRFDRIIATDISAPALVVARRNLARVRPGTPVEFREGSLLEPLRGETVGLIVANPPYLTTGECGHLAPEVRDYEPLIAFDGGPEGLDPFRAILAGAAGILHDGGLLALEIDSRRPGPVLDLALASGWADARISADVFGRARYLTTTKGPQ